MAAFSTLMIGPDGRGRDFRVRAQAQAPEATTAPEAQARNLPLILARWAETAEPEVAACLPLPGGDRIVLRARNQGRTESGFACYAHGVIVPGGWGEQQERVCLAVLGLIPEPDGSDAFARKPLAVEQLHDPAVAAHGWDGLEPRWHRRVVVSDGTPAETVVASILADARDDAGPVLGWATSVHWASTLGEAALIVVAPGRDSQADGFTPARMTAAGFDGQAFHTPVAVRLRERFLGLVAADIREAAGRRVAPDASVGEQVTAVATEAVAGLDYDHGLAQVLRFGAVPASEFDGFFTRLSQRLFGGFVAAQPLRRTLEVFETANPSLLRGLGPLAGHVLASPALCAGLDTAMVDRLVARHDLIGVLAARPDLARILGDVRPVVATALYDRLLAGEVTETAAHALATAARRLFPGMDLGGMAAVLNRQLTLPASFMKTQLLIELVLLVYQSDLPASRRYG